MVDNKLVIYYLVIWLVELINSSASPKFNFKKVFKTPRENYEARIAELNKCEILERSSFSSEDQDENKAAGPESNQSDPRVFVNTEVNVRFGGDSETSKPTLNEPATNHPSNHLAPPLTHPQYLPYFPSPYTPGHFGLPFGQAPYHPYSGTGWYNPYHYHFYPGFHQFVPAPHLGHNPQVFSNAKGLFAPFNYTHGVHLGATTKPPASTEKPSTSHPEQECSYPKNGYRKTTDLKDLPFDKWMALAMLSNYNRENGNGGTHWGSNDPYIQKAKGDDATMDHNDSSPSSCGCFTTPSNCAVTTMAPPVCSSKTITPQHMSTIPYPPRTQKASNDIALPGDVILQNIENAPPCKDLHLNADCLYRSGNVRFVKIKASDLGRWGDGKIVLNDSSFKVSKAADDTDCSGCKVINYADDIDCRNTRKTVHLIDDSEAQKNMNGLDLKICEEVDRNVSENVDEIRCFNNNENNKFIDLNAYVSSSNDDEKPSHIGDLIFTNDQIGEDHDDGKRGSTNSGTAANLHDESCSCGKANSDGKPIYNFGDIHQIKSSPQMPYPYPPIFFNLNPWWMSANKFEPYAVYPHFKPSLGNECTQHVAATPKLSLEKE